MSEGKSRTARIVVALAVAASLWLAATALGNAPTTASRTTTVPALVEGGTATPVRAKCPKGKWPVSGGYEMDNSDSFPFNTSEGIFDSANKRWSLTTLSLVNASRVTSLAYCARRGRDIKFRSARTRLGPGDSATVTATCKRGERALSGGYAFSGHGLSLGLVTKSFRADSRSWSARGAYFQDEGDDVTFLVFANCKPKQSVPKLTKAAKKIPFLDEGTTSGTARCPRNRYAMSGGFQIPGDFPEIPSISRRAGSSGWHIETGGVNGRDDKMTVLAYCAPK